MVRNAQEPSAADRSAETMAFVAPCRTLDRRAPLRWLRLGWNDLQRAPGPSLSYGTVMAAVSWAVSLLAWKLGTLAMLLALASGFILLGPILAIGLYSVSAQLAMGRRPYLGYCLVEGKRHLGNEMIFGFMLLIVFLVWARAASMVHVFFPMEAHPPWRDLVTFLTIGSAVGAVFCAIVFSASAFSLPMIMERRVDTVTAVVTSVNAVLRNKGVMLLWAALIGAAVAVGFATLFVGLVVLLPVLGHATWHAYRETIDAAAWPVNEGQSPAA
ncbi:MAG: DUF2189 domain-containing protein [Gammaproteobacteria bacterium]